MHRRATGPRPTMLPLRVSDLSLRFREAVVLDCVNLEVESPGCTMVMGPNGAGGKSLFLKVLHGLVPPSGGRIDWAGKAPADRHAAPGSCVPEAGPFLRRSVAANLDFVLRARGSRAAPARRAPRPRGARPQGRPGRPAPVGRRGTKARPRPGARHRPRSPAARRTDREPRPPPRSSPSRPSSTPRAGRGVKIVFVTHDVGQARRMADDVVFMHRGRVAEHSPARRFFAEPPKGRGRARLSRRPHRRLTLERETGKETT